MAVSMDTIKELREKTSCGVIDCKNALDEAGGDLNKAVELLKKRKSEIAAKKGSRDAKEGRVETYIHPGNKVAVMIELNCETDFVAKNEDFVALSKDIAMHIAAMGPSYLSREDVPEDVIAEQANKDEYYKSSCLLEQSFVKDSSKTIQELITEVIGSIGENIQVGRYVRYKVGS